MTARLIAGASGYSYKEWQGSFYPERSSPMRCSASTPGACRPSRSTIRSTGCRNPTCSKRGATRRLTHSDSRSRHRGASRTTRGSRPRTRPTRSPTCTKTLPRSAPSAGPCYSSCRHSSRRICRASKHSSRSCPRIIARHSSSATRAGSTTTSTRRSKTQTHRSALSEREDNAPPPLVETAPIGYIRLRLEEYGEEDLKRWSERLLATGWQEIYVYFMHADRAAVRRNLAASRLGMTMLAEPLSINIDPARRVSALLIAPDDARACCVLAHGAGAGMTHPFMARVAEAFAFERHRDAEIPVRVHGARLEAARHARDRARGRSCGVRRSRAALARDAVDRRRQVVRRPHDLAGPGDRADRPRARACVSRLSAASSRNAIGRSCEASLRCRRADAVPLGNARRARRSGTPRTARREAWREGNARDVSRGRSFVPRAARSGHTDAANIARIAELTSAWLDRNVLRKAQP